MRLCIVCGEAIWRARLITLKLFALARFDDLTAIPLFLEVTHDLLSYDML